jgi:hypothetical protein
MNTSEKKYKGSVIAVIFYVLAALMLIYTCYQAGNTVASIKEYYAQYQMNATPSEYVTYILQSALEPLFNAVVLFALGYIINEVRKNNPAYYISEEEKADAKDAKKAAKDEKLAAKGEAAAAKEAAKYEDSAEGNTVIIEEKTVTDEKPVKADFAVETKAEESTSEPKTEAKAAEAKKYEPKTEEKTEKKADAEKAEKSDNQNRDRKPAQKKQGASGNNNSKDRKSAAKKDGESKKDGEAKGESKKEGEARKSDGNSKEKKPASKKQNSGNKPKKSADGKQNQKSKPKKPENNDDTVSIPWEVDADFTADLPDNE